METTTPDGGASQAQPTTTEAVTTGHNADQVITTDSNGTPSLEPVTSQSSEAAVITEAQPQETQATTEAADKSDQDILDWAEKKGLKIDPANPNEVKLARMQLETDRKFHESTQKPVIPPPEPIQAATEDPTMQTLVENQNINNLRMYVRDWFDANPEMREHRTELTQITQERPWLTNMDDVKAHFLANPQREAQLKTEGGREALTNLAQKQQQVPPGANATNSGVYESTTITPQNVSDLVDRNDQAWFEKNHDAINKALSGK